METAPVAETYWEPCVNPLSREWPPPKPEPDPRTDGLLDPDELGFWLKSRGRLARNSDKYPHNHPLSVQRRFHIRAGSAIDRLRKDLTTGQPLPLEWVDWIAEEILFVLAELRDKALTDGTQTNGTRGEGGDSP